MGIADNVIEMKGNSTGGATPVEDKGKISYEDLQKLAAQLSQQNDFYRRKLEQVDIQSFSMRLNYLFEILKNAKFFDESFVEKCAGEIVELMNIPSETEK